MAPRATIRRIVDNDPEYGVLVLSALTGAAHASIDIAERWEPLDISLAILAPLVAIAGAVRGLVTLYIEGWMLLTIGRWFGGTATGAEVRLAIAWSNVPVVTGIAIGWLLWVTLQPSEDIMLVVVAALLFWSVILLALCLATVQ